MKGDIVGPANYIPIKNLFIYKAVGLAVYLKENSMSEALLNTALPFTNHSDSWIDIFFPTHKIR